MELLNFTKKNTIDIWIILDECNRCKYYPHPVKVHLDFEISVIDALKNIIDSHLTIMGCLYHFC